MVSESLPERVRYGWACGCHAISADEITCLVTTCASHETLFPAQTAVRDIDPEASQPNPGS